MQNYDVIIAGSGPAGATTARTLAKAGLSVLILEKDIKDFIEAIVHGAYISYGKKEGTHLMSEQPVAYMVMRDKLDAHLTYEAVKAGATLLTEKKVVGITTAKNGYEVFTKNDA